MVITKSDTNGFEGDKKYPKSNLSYFHNVGENPLVHRTIGQELSLVVKEFGDCEAFVFVEEAKRITFGELLREADRLAAGFQCLGLNKGDRLAILGPNVASWPVVMYAAARAGLIAVHLNPTHDSQEIQKCLEKVSAKILVALGNKDFSNNYDKFLDIIPDLGSFTSGIIKYNKLPNLLSIVIDSEQYYAGTHRLCDIMKQPTCSQIQNIEAFQCEISPDSGCHIIFTSGFTGTPKAVLISHFGIINTGYNWGQLGVKHSILCMPLPFCHISGAGFLTIGCLCNRSTLVIPSALYDPGKILYGIWQEKCKFLSGTPSMLMDVLAKQKEIKLDIKNITMLPGGLPCTQKLFEQLKKEFHMKKLMVAFGMTECCGLSFLSRPSDHEKLPLESVGKILDHLEVKVVDGEGKLVPFGSPGELCVRGYATFMKYWDDEEKTRKFIDVGRWLRTGDCFILQPNGYGKIIGRLDEMISKGTEIIYPIELEDLLITCPSIAEVYVVGVPDEEWGEELCAFVRLAEGVEVFTLNDLQNFCHGKVPSLRIPRYVQVVEDFPKTLAGKILKHKLKKYFCK